MTSPKTHKKMDDLTLTVTEADVKINKVISNGEYKVKLRVVKIDKETKETQTRLARRGHIKLPCWYQKG